MNIADIESYFEQAIPSSYKEFLSGHTKEMEGDVYLYLLQDLIERNDCYETKTYANGYINIGDNGGGEAFIIALGSDDPEVSIVGHGSMDPTLKEFVCSSFSRWVASGFEYDNE
ncbi:hypothetical protein R50073_45740 [Maricurvus nonylphenolicus]